MAATGTEPDGGSSAGASVELRLPPDGAYASVLRTTTAALAARLDFTIEDIEDLRMAVGEAHAMVLEQSQPRSDLLCRFLLAPGEMTVSIDVASTAGVPDLDSFAWQVLTTLATSADVDALGDRFTVSLTMTSSTAVPAPGAGR